MLTQIKLNNFKCFKDIELNLSHLNIFSGLNGTGKSSVIQAILLLQQSYAKGYLPYKVCLNGDYTHLGTGRDILYENAEKDFDENNEIIKIETSSGELKQSYIIKYESDSDVLDVIQQKKINSVEPFIFRKEFEYLNAERASPQTIYPKSSYHVDTRHQLGINGQYAVHYLSKFQDSLIPWNSCCSNEKNLKGAVQYWLSEISPNIRIDIQDITYTDLSKIGYYYFSNIIKSNIVRPTNNGFGISYVLPVIISLLKAEAESILIIENPEAHLHPKGQRKIGELIARCAASGVQIFIETHSDHILNGIRIAVKNNQIKSKDTSVLFFQKKFNKDGIEHTFLKPIIKNNGKFDFWPDDFFDEWDKALDQII